MFIDFDFSPIYKADSGGSWTFSFIWLLYYTFSCTSSCNVAPTDFGIGRIATLIILSTFAGAKSTWIF